MEEKKIFTNEMIERNREKVRKLIERFEKAKQENKQSLTKEEIK